MQILPCGHKFHRKCLRKWFVENTCCPNCRFDLKAYFKQKKAEEEKQIEKSNILKTEAHQLRDTHLKDLNQMTVKLFSYFQFKITES